MTLAVAGLPSTGGAPLPQLTATGNHNSMLVMAGRDVHLHTPQTLATIPVMRDEVEAVRKAWVKIDQQGRPLTAAPEVVALLQQDEPVVVIAGARGMGKTAIAVKALSDYSRHRFDARAAVPEDAGHLKLEHVPPDWDEPDAGVLPVGRERGYILDVSEEIDQWKDRSATAKKIVAHGEKLRCKGSVLVVIASDDGWPASHAPALGRIVVRVIARPPGNLITRAHLTNLYPQAVPRWWLAAGGDAERGGLDDLLRADMLPCDAAARALELSRIPDSPDALEVARATASKWRDVVKDVFARTRSNADDRALLLAAIMLEGRAPTQVLAAARLLLKEKTEKSIREILTGPDLATRIESIQASSGTGGVTFAHKPGYASAVLRYVWRQLSDVQDPLLEWVKEITRPGGLGAGRIAEIVGLLARLAIDEKDLRVLDVARFWATCDHVQGKTSAAAMLATAASDPALGTITRNKLRSWARQDSTDTAAVTAVVCQGTFAMAYPRQALTCLRWILERPDHDFAVCAAEEALRTMAAGLTLLPRVWATVTAWIGGQSRLAGRRAFLALLDPQAAPDTVDVLLTDALTDARTAQELVRGWCALLDDRSLADPCERLLEKWAQAVADGSVIDDAVVAILDHVVDQHLITGPMAAFLLGRQGHAYNSPAVISMREQLMVRRRGPARPVGAADSRRATEAGEA